jgi:hypothetical protein
MLCHKAGCLSYGAIDIDQVSAPTTCQVVVIINTMLVAGSRSRGLNATNDSMLGHYVQSIVNGLTRDDSQLEPHRLANIIGNRVRRRTHCLIDSQALGSNLQTHGFERPGNVDRILTLTDIRFTHR